MITQNLSTLKIHKLTQVQYERELEAGRIDENAIYLTPDEGTDLSIYALKEDIPDISNKVDKVEGKGLSTNDYTTAEKNKLAGIDSGAEANVQADFNQSDETASDYIKNRTHYKTQELISTEVNVSSYAEDFGSGQGLECGLVFDNIEDLILQLNTSVNAYLKFGE